MTLQRFTIAIAALLVGLSAGFFFTYEASVTLGLAQVDDVTYVKTFQAINDTIRNFWFAIVFFGSLPALVLAFAVNDGSKVRTRALLGVAFGLYVICVGITMGGNVPLNDELGAVTGITSESAAVARADFEDDWNQLNLMRTIAVVASFACVIAAAMPTKESDLSEDTTNPSSRLVSSF